MAEWPYILRGLTVQRSGKCGDSDSGRVAVYIEGTNGTEG